MKLMNVLDQHTESRDCLDGIMIDSENVSTYRPLLTVGIACLDAHLKVRQLSWTLITNNHCTVEKYAHEYHRTMLIHMPRGIYR